MTIMLMSSKRLLTVGRWFFALGIVAWGVQHLVWGDFVTRVAPSWPAWMPARTPSAYALGVLLIALGTAMIAGVKPRAAAVTFAVVALASFFVLHLPNVMSDALLGGAWTSAGKALVMCSGALIVARSWSPSTRNDARTLLFGRCCLGAFMTLCGIQHFLYVGFVASLIPGWIPGAVFWTYFAAVALIAGGVGLLVPPVARLAALLSGAMIFSWVFLVHVPLALGNPHDGGNVAAVFEALAFSGVAFMLAALTTRLGKPQTYVR
jgi:uncharacterized membrane protein